MYLVNKDVYNVYMINDEVVKLARQSALEGRASFTSAAQCNIAYMS